MRGRCDLIALVKDVSPLRVAQDHPLHTHIADHLRTGHDGIYEQLYTVQGLPHLRILYTLHVRH